MDIDLRPLLGKDRDALLDRLAVVCSDLASAYLAWAYTARSEKEAKVHGFMQSQAGTIAGKERDADSQALSFSVELLHLTADIKALTEERDFILLLLGAPNARQSRPVDHDSGLPSGDQG